MNNSEIFKSIRCIQQYRSDLDDLEYRTEQISVKLLDEENLIRHWFDERIARYLKVITQEFFTSDTNTMDLVDIVTDTWHNGYPELLFKTSEFNVR
jgi:hypothetical protein